MADETKETDETPTPHPDEPAEVAKRLAVCEERLNDFDERVRQLLEAHREAKPAHRKASS